jgi:hypothetical protein
MLYRKALRTCIEVAAFPLVGVAIFVVAMLAASIHLVALPALFLWEKFHERRPLKAGCDARSSITTNLPILPRIVSSESRAYGDAGDH